MKAPYERTRSYGPVLGPQLQCTGMVASATHIWALNPPRWKLTSSSGSSLVGVSGAGTYDSDVMTDVVTPGYAFLQASGHIINNDMTKVVTTQRWIEPLNLQVGCLWRTVGVKQMSWNIAGVPKATNIGIATTSGPNMLQLAASGPYVSKDIGAEASWTLAEAFQAMSKSPLNVWVTTGEFSESVESFLGIYRKLDALLDFRKKPNKDALVRAWTKRRKSGSFLKWKDLGLCSNHWLEVRYGLRPLVRELLAALKLLERTLTKTRRRFASTREIKCDPLSQLQQRNAANGLTAYPDIGYQIQALWEREFSISAGVLAEPKFDENNLLTLIGAGSLVQGLWDLVPYSFVINWFVNVSAWLSSYAPSLLVEPKACWTIVRETERRTCKVTEGSLYIRTPSPGYGPLAEVSVCRLTGSIQWEKTSLTRVANPSRAVLPEVRFALRAANVLDAFSLLFQQLR